jgi:hypothetical protein
MRKITFAQMAVFTVLFSASMALTVSTAALTLGALPKGDFRGVAVILGGLIMLYVYEILVYRGFLRIFPLKAGEIDPGSSQEFVYHVYVLFYIMLFYPVMRSGILPVPLMRGFYLALGARLGENTYSQGIIHDPPFVRIGRNSVVGQSALLIPHVIEGNRLAHYPIRLGDNVTIGANAVVLSDVTIEDGSIVACGSVVRKGTHIRPREIWGGVPAKRIGRVGASADDP